MVLKLFQFQADFMVDTFKLEFSPFEKTESTA